MNNYVHRVFFLPLTYVGNFVTSKTRKYSKNLFLSFPNEELLCFSPDCKAPLSPTSGCLWDNGSWPTLPYPCQWCPGDSQEGWSPAVTLAIINIVGTPAQKNTGLGVRKFQFNICLEFSGFLFVFWGSTSAPLMFYKDTLWIFYSLWIAKQFLKLISLLWVKIWGEMVSFPTSVNGAEGRTFYVWAAWETCACSVSVMHLLCVLFRYDHTRPSAAAGGAVGSMPHSVPSPGFHSPHPPSDLTAPIVKTNLHEPGKREKRTLVLRDRSEWAESFCCLFLKSSLVLFFIFLSGLLLTRRLLNLIPLQPVWMQSHQICPKNGLHLAAEYLDGAFGLVPKAGLNPKFGLAKYKQWLFCQLVTTICIGCCPVLRSTKLFISKLRILIKSMYHCFTPRSVHSLSFYGEPVFAILGCTFGNKNGMLGFGEWSVPWNRIWAERKLKIIKIVFVGWSSSGEGISRSWNVWF